MTYIGVFAWGVICGMFLVSVIEEFRREFGFD
jgi:hypothetical protein